MTEPKIVRERETRMGGFRGMFPDYEKALDTIRIFASALAGKWHDGKCEQIQIRKHGGELYCHCNTRLLEQYHAH